MIRRRLLETGDLARAFPRFAADFEWWAEAGKAQRALKAPPY